MEDDSRDAELIEQECQREWPNCKFVVVETRAAFVSELSKEHDLILSDFNLLKFDGLEALRLAREHAADIPFIFLSGTIGEDRAIDALHAGANDYVIKDRPKRLIPAIQRALNDARLRRERLATEEQILRVQRLENIGMLAAGIAHDFNNVLAPILMGIPLLRTDTTTAAELRILANMETSVERGAGLVRQILGFAHGVTGEAQLIQPVHLIRDLLGMLRQTFPKRISILDDSSDKLWPLKVNSTQLHQVLLNLFVNARDAMPQGGELHFRASNRPLDEAEAAVIKGAKPGPHLCLEVIDSGTGIPPEVLARMWEPFFTTKDPGRGTGLGLATVRGIIEGHHGAISVHTRPGQGTTFQIFLPASPGSETIEFTAKGVAAPRGCGELMLVVDDDASVRDITAATLVGHGYRVLAAADGTEALALFAPRNLEIKAVISDVDMPNLSGTELVKVIHALNPAVGILLVSGSSELEELKKRTPPYGRLLPKPFTADTLLATLHEMLNRTADLP